MILKLSLQAFIRSSLDTYSNIQYVQIDRKNVHLYFEDGQQEVISLKEFDTMKVLPKVDYD